MADDVMKTTASEAHAAPKRATVPARAESRADRARRRVYRGRFALLFFLLAIGAGVAVGSLAVLVSRGSPVPAPEWSAWEPTGSGERRAAQIGDRISDGYRLPSGNALAPVTSSGPPTASLQDGTPIQYRAISVERDLKSAGDDIDVFPSNTTLMYTLCGRGPRCTIPEGADTADRRRLVRREALELALYSFKYVDVAAVLVLMPPRVSGDQAVPGAVFLQRSDVQRELSIPLNETLTAELTPGVGEISAEETRSIDRLTRSRVYLYRPLQQQDGTFLMDLVPVPALG